MKTHPPESTGLREGPFSSIYLRLLVPFAFLLLLGTVLAWLLGTALLSSALEARVSQQLARTVDVMSERSFPMAEPVMARLNNLLDTSIHFIDAEGQILSPASESPSPSIARKIQEAYLRWLAGGEEQGEYRIRFSGSEYLLAIKAAPAGRLQEYRAVLALTDMADVQAATRRGGLLLAGLTFFALSLLAFIGHLVARTITGPVAELANMAGKIAGGERDVRVDVPRRDEVGTLAHSLNIMAETLSRYEAQVAEQSRLATMGELSVKMAHEIRNPLTAIKMQLQLLGDDIEDASDSRLAPILDEVRRLELIVSSSLQLGHPEKLERVRLDLNGLVRDVLRLTEPQFQHRRIEVRQLLEDGLPPVLLDGDRIKQILLNLLTNAMDELGNGGTVRVTTSSEADGYVALIVEDSGSGVPPSQRDGLFEQSESTKSTGFGLGLRVTGELVELHGGSIAVADSDLGGARFLIRFPLGE